MCFGGEIDFECVKIDFEDVRDEIEYWEYVVVVYVFGSNLFMFIMEVILIEYGESGGIYKIVFFKKGIFIFCFYIMENRKKFFEDEYLMFDIKIFYCLIMEF